MSQTTGTLKRGLKVGEVMHKEFELRPDVTASDWFAAEDDAQSRTSLRFEAALVARQLVRIGSFEGPFSSALLGKLHPDDLAILLNAAKALEDAGNVASPGEQSSSPARP